MKKPLRVYVTYEESCVEVVSDTTGENGLYSGHRHDRYDYRIKNAYLVCPSNITPYWDEFTMKVEQVPVTVWVLYVRYSTGDTFGHSEGRGTVAGVYPTMEEACKYKNQINRDEWKGHAVWKGYFENLESVHVEPLTVYG